MNLRSHRWSRAVVLPVGCTVVWAALVAHAQTGRLVTQRDLAQILEVRDVRVEAERASATLVNHSPRALQNVRLLVRHQWLWRDEKNPGTDNPGRSQVYTLPDEVPAGGTYRVELPIDPPLPRRTDGRFVSSVEVLGFTEVGF